MAGLGQGNRYADGPSCEPAQPRVSLGVRLVGVRGRLIDLNNALRSLGKQSHGPEPENGESAEKAPQDTLDLVTGHIERMLAESEARVQKLAAFIGV